MGPVVFIDATVKIFLTASAEERGRRRYEQLRQKGFNASLPALIEDIRARDERARPLAVAPLRPADDALLIDGTLRSLDEVCELVMNQVRNLGLI